jgi:hypothetical protein
LDIPEKKENPKRQRGSIRILRWRFGFFHSSGAASGHRLPVGHDSNRDKLHGLSRLES